MYRRDSGSFVGFGALSGLNTLEMCAGRDTVIHRLHPFVKMAATIVYVAVVVSFGRYEVSALTPYFLYPAILVPLSETPPRILMRRLLPALPFTLFGGIGNVLFDTEPVMSVGGFAVTGGVVSFVSIMSKTVLSVSAVLLLVSATGMADLSRQLVFMKVPELFVLQLVLTYRYLGVLTGETGTLYEAYAVRCPGARGIRMGDTGAFVGALLLRSIDRAGRVYSAMKCRGFSGAYPTPRRERLGAGDMLILAAVCGAMIIPRCLS
ncbi:MAG: cobalt ECF transporter T component CbiQ [Synergistaceae bacterium]|jgi:cobalt/nickel transport system permease protein|nr:cobalt ECF transporter T component CbiQ [Synergistaceae bacterium]